MIEAFAWSGWLWAGCIYFALRTTTRERDFWRDRWLQNSLDKARQEIKR